MDISSLRKIRTRGKQSGFTLLELMFAIIVMNVLVTVTVRQIMVQHELVQSLEEWYASDPVMYVDPAIDPIFRAVEVAPTLKATDPNSVWVKQAKDPLQVKVGQIKQDLKKFKAKADLVQIPL